jgi:hypothetical protein
MQAARVSSRAFKAVAAGSKQSRSLHMTGPATFSNLLTSERPAMNHPQSMAGLRYECQVLRLPTTGSKEEVRSPTLYPTPMPLLTQSPAAIPPLRPRAHKRRPHL